MVQLMICVAIGLGVARLHGVQYPSAADSAAGE
jgi:hypothetical protein